MFLFGLLETLATSVSVEIDGARAGAYVSRKGARADPVAGRTFFVITKLEPAESDALARSPAAARGIVAIGEEGIKTYRS